MIYMLLLHLDLMFFLLLLFLYEILIYIFFIFGDEFYTFFKYIFTYLFKFWLFFCYIEIITLERGSMSIIYCFDEKSSIFIFSQLILNLLKDFILLEASIPFSYLNLFIQWLTNQLSISSPPNWVSPPITNT